MKSKKEIMEIILGWMEDFISGKITGKKFVNLYMPFWNTDLREAKDGYDKKSYSNKEHDLLDELHSDCDCLNYPIEDESSRRISLTEDQLKEIVKEKLTKLSK